jgi:two-component system response regulator YesN
MLLDDEEIVIKGIQKVFDLNALGFEVVGTFQNPLKALEQADVLKPDLIITDIKMPQMDGLEFVSFVKQKLPDVEIVILSGYDDFSYAQTAVKLEVSDYLLKPIKKEDFKNMLQRIYRKIEEKLSQKSYYHSLQKFAENNYTELKNHLFLHLAEEGVFDEDCYRALKKNWAEDFLQTAYLLVKADIYQIETAGDYMSELGKINHQLREELSAYGDVEEFFSDESFYYFLYGVEKEIETDVKSSMRAFSDAKRQEGIPFAVGVSHVYKGLDQMFMARNDCVRQILMFEVNIDDETEMNPVRRQDVNLTIPYMEIENLFRSVSVGDTKNMRESVEKIYEYPGNTLPLMYRDYSFSITFLILLRICQLQNKYDVSEAIVSQKLLELKNLRKEYPTAEEQKKLVANSACKLSNLIASQEVGTPSKIILSALDYINIHFSENISLSDVADNINLSKNYLCDLFKKELGVTFINYVTNLRIEKAKEYLVSTDMKMYEVSDAVGYSDYAYFSQIFKKHTGITLSAYRRQN